MYTIFMIVLSFLLLYVFLKVPLRTYSCAPPLEASTFFQYQDQPDDFTMSRISLLTSIDSTEHIHLVIGSNPLAAARCAKSLEVGAKPLLIAPETAELHYALQKRIDNGEVEWLKKSFKDEDVLRLGREEINGVVDAVFVTSGPRDPLSMEAPLLDSSESS